jgi:hypothetical protein
LLRDYGRPGGIPTFVEAPYWGQSAVIADYAKGLSLVRVSWLKLASPMLPIFRREAPRSETSRLRPFSV